MFPNFKDEESKEPPPLHVGGTYYPPPSNNDVGGTYYPSPLPNTGTAIGSSRNQPYPSGDYDTLPTPQPGAPGHVTNTTSTQAEDKLEKCAKYTLVASIIPPIGCLNYFYHNWINAAAHRSTRQKFATYSVYVSCITALGIILSVVLSKLFWLLWVFLGCFIVFCVVLCVVPKFRRIVFQAAGKKIAGNPQVQREAARAVVGGMTNTHTHTHTHTPTQGKSSKIGDSSYIGV
eukprot:GHVR01109530.1.p1 GENE.GHVR01109530.1~~GHVR01109530.1.p1  ORF type:complete len:232 (+),score=73.72 GHVR01109530.1:22-717(+)